MKAKVRSGLLLCGIALIGLVAVLAIYGICAKVPKESRISANAPLSSRKSPEAPVSREVTPEADRTRGKTVTIAEAAAIQDFYRAIGVDSSPAWGDLSPADRESIIGQSISVLRSSNGRKAIMILLGLRALKAKAPSLARELVAFYEEYKGDLSSHIRREAVELVALQADATAKDFLYAQLGLSSDSDALFVLSKALRVLAEQGGVTSGDPISENLLARLRGNSRDPRVADYAEILVASRDPSLMRQLGELFLGAHPQRDVLLVWGLGSALIEQGPTFLSEVASQWNTYNNGQQRNVLVAVEKVASKHGGWILTEKGLSDGIRSVLLRALESNDNDTLIHACSILASSGSIRNPPLDARLHSIISTASTQEVRQAASRALNSRER